MTITLEKLQDIPSDDEGDTGLGEISASSVTPTSRQKQAAAEGRPSMTPAEEDDLTGNN